MLNKKNRLTKNKYFQYIYRKGEKFSSANITVLYAKTRFRPIKIGITVSNKVGDAVTRNKVKRRLRVLIRKNLNNLNQKYNYIFVVRPNIVNLSFEDMSREFNYLIKKGGLYCEGA